MFLGIRYDHWHGILAALVFEVIFFSGFFIILSGLSLVVGPGFALLLINLSAIFMALLLQSLNESIQALDENIEKEYGSWKNFQINSRKDWKFFLMGIIAGQIISGLFTIIYLYIHS